MMRMLEEFENNSTLTRVGPGIKIPLEAQSIYWDPDTHCTAL